MDLFSLGSLSNGGAGLPGGGGGSSFGSYLNAGMEVADEVGLTGGSPPISSFAVSDSGPVTVSVGGFYVPAREHQSLSNSPANPFQLASFDTVESGLTNPNTFTGKVAIGVTVTIVSGLLYLLVKKK